MVMILRTCGRLSVGFIQAPGLRLRLQYTLTTLLSDDSCIHLLIINTGVEICSSCLAIARARSQSIAFNSTLLTIAVACYILLLTAPGYLPSTAITGHGSITRLQRPRILLHMLIDCNTRTTRVCLSQAERVGKPL